MQFLIKENNKNNDKVFSTLFNSLEENPVKRFVRTITEVKSRRGNTLVPSAVRGTIQLHEDGEVDTIVNKFYPHAKLESLASELDQIFLTSADFQSGDILIDGATEQHITTKP